MSLPGGYLDTSSYKISLKLTNFLGGSSTSEVEILIVSKSVPVITIFGNSFKQISRMQSLSLTSDVYTTRCTPDGGTIKSNKDLVYVWSVYQGEDDVTNDIYNTAKSPNLFKLAPFSLKSGEIYTITLSVLYSKDLTSSDISVTVFVKPSEIVALISGGAEMSLLPGRSITLDASGSYDLDLSLDETAYFSYNWKCMTIKPRLSLDCGLQYDSDKNNSYVTLKALNSIEIFSQYQITVEVSDDKRSSIATVSISIIEGGSPILSILNDVPKMNPSQKVVIGASIEVPDSFVESKAHWIAVNNKDVEVDISETALTSTDFDVSTTPGTYFFYMVLGSNALPEFSVTTFKLLCQHSSASIVVVMNGPPQPGIFEVSPTEGVELDTNFLFSASLWSDDDLPVSYEFGFYATNFSEAIATVKSRSESSFAYSNLPAGEDTLNFKIRSVASVLDSLNAQSTAVSWVTVTRFVAIDPKALADTIGSRLEAAMNSSNPEDTLKFLSVASAVMNFINCSTTSVDYCNQLNRHPCSNTQQTCGPCFDDFVGSEGDSNTQCMVFQLPTVTNDDAPIDTFKRCEWDGDCGNPWEFCNDIKQCEFKDKSCTNDCNSNGQCLYSSIFTGESTPICKMNDLSCESICICNDGWDGFDCGISQEAMLAKLNLRESMMASMTSVLDSVDEAGALSALTNIKMMCQNPAELSLHASSMAMDSTDTLLSISAASDVPYENLLGNFDTIDNVQTAMTRRSGNPTSASRRLSSDSTDVFSLMSSMASVIMNQMFDGQVPVTKTKSNLRMSSSVAKNSGDNVKVLSPLSLMEQLANMKPFGIEISKIADPQPTKITTSIALSKAFGSDAAEKFLSNPLMVSVDDITTCQTMETGKVGCQFTFEIQNNKGQVYGDKDIDRTTLQNFTSTCVSGVLTHYQYACNNNFTVSYDCDGKVDGDVISYCPYKIRAPQCYVNSKSDDCNVVSYNALSTTCTCLLTSDNLRRRRALSTSSAFSLQRRRRLSTSTDSNAYEGQVTSEVSDQVVTPQAVVVGAPTYKPTQKPKAPTASYTPVSIQITQQVDGLDYSDLDSDDEINSNGRVIIIAVKNIINQANSWSLTESDITIDSVSSSSRRYLVAGVNVVYTVTGGQSGISPSTATTLIENAIKNSITSGSFTSGLVAAHSSLGGAYTGSTDFTQVSASVTPVFVVTAVYTPNPTVEPTRFPTIGNTNTSIHRI